jgi:transposase-like protein
MIQMTLFFAQKKKTQRMPKKAKKAKKSKKVVKRRAQLTKSEKLEIVELRTNEEWSLRRIAKKYDRSVRTIDRVLACAAKQSSLGRRTKLGKEEKRAIKAMIEENASITCGQIVQNPLLTRVNVGMIRVYLRKKGYSSGACRKKPVWQKRPQQQ